MKSQSASACKEGNEEGFEIENMIELLEHKDEKVLTDVCRKLYSLTKGTREDIQAVIDKEIIPFVVNLLSHAEVNIRKAAAQVISNVTSRGHTLQRLHLVEQGCIEPLREQLGEGDENVIILCQHTKDNNIFKELTIGYDFTTNWKQDEDGKYELGEKTTEYIDMSAPRYCTYEKNNNDTKKYETIGIPKPDDNNNNDTDTRKNNTIQIEERLPTNTSPVPEVELRGITLRQLRAADSNIDRRCEKEVWRNIKGTKLTPKTVTLYDANDFLILPFTKDREQSFVSRLPSTAGPQPPRFFVSHWWGETVADFIKCIEQFIRDFSRNYDELDDERGGGMSADTPIWVCAYGNNQHELDKDITPDPRDSGFNKAIKVAKGRVITILDNGGDNGEIKGGGVVFSRIWCVFELFLTLIDMPKEDKTEKSTDGVWAVYTAEGHTYKKPYGRQEEEVRESVGIISGGATCDYGDIRSIAAREKHFPFKLIEKSLTIKVEDAQSSKECDRVHILNSIRGITGDEINEPPLVTDDKYTAVDDALKATFASSVPILQSAAKRGDEVWDDFTTALSKGEKDIEEMTFDFSEDGWDDLKADKVTQLVAHLPLNIRMLYIMNANFDRKFVDTVIRHIGKSQKMEIFILSNTSFGDADAGQELGLQLLKIISSNNTIKTLYLYRTDLMVSKNVQQWGKAFINNTTLTTLYLRGVTREAVSELRLVLKDRRQKLELIISFD